MFGVSILENDEGPRWQFGYSGKRVTDFNPDILLLGAYRHPSTGNHLVGGINLHYISDEQRDELARSLPEIMRQNNLKTRYWTGRRLLPDIFNNYYRTYNSRYIQGVQKDVMYPKYGYVKTAKNWLKKKLGSVLKTKDQREKDLEPKYQPDLKSMQDRLDQAVLQLSQEPQDQYPDDTPEIIAARKAFQDFQRKKTLRDIERQEDEPMMTARRDLARARRIPGIQAAEVQDVATPEIDAPQDIVKDVALDASQRFEQSIQQPEQAQTQAFDTQAFDVQKKANQAELNDPANEIDPDIDLEESIYYYSPVVGHYIFEKTKDYI